MRKTQFILLSSLLLACHDSKDEQTAHREKSIYSLELKQKVSFSYPYTYTLYQPSTISFYMKNDRVWAQGRFQIEYDSLEFRYYSDSRYSRHRFKKGHSYGENLFPPDTHKVLRKKIKHVKKDSALTKYSFPSREAQNYLITLNDSSGNAYEFSFHSSYRCPDPFCEMKHGHMNFNQTIYANAKYGWSFQFNELDKKSFSLGFQKNGEKMPLEIVTQLLNRHLFPKEALKAVKEYYLN